MAVVRALIHLDNFRHNIAILQKLAGGRPLCLAVKADAYGHGALHIVREAEKCGVNLFGVSRISEASALRDAGVQTGIVMFTIAAREELAALWDYNVQPFVGDAEYFQCLVDVQKRVQPSSTLKVHIKVDTGMGRVGCAPSEVLALATAIEKQPGFVVEGVASHYPLSDSPDSTLCRAQILALQNMRAELRAAGIQPRYYHIANSGGLLYYSDDDFDLARPGIAAYGYLPGGSGLHGAGSARGAREELRPVMELRAEVAFVKKVAAGTAISYGHAWKCDRECWIATINVGYADGYPRLVSNKASVIINGGVYPQVGRICMDQCMVNLGPAVRTPVKRFDEAVIFGPDSRGESAASLAEKASTIPYEITCGIASRVQRIYWGSM